MTAPWAGTPFEAEYHRLQDKVERLEEEVHLWHSCVHEPGEIDERLRENATLRVKVERLEARCDELNEACGVKQALLDHVAEDQRDMLALVEKEKGTFREEVKVLRWFLREVQWSGKAPTTPDRYCPGCLRAKEEGHHTDCVITVALSNDKVVP